MKKKSIILSLIVIAIIAAAAWYFMRPVHYCEVVYSENPSTKSLVVSCDDKNCDKTCYLYFRKKDSGNEWGIPNDSHTFDTTAWEYRCKCIK